jgi:hypothetical protein
METIKLTEEQIQRLRNNAKHEENIRVFMQELKTIQQSLDKIQVSFVDELPIDKDLDINNLYAERRNKDGIYFLSNLMRCSRPQGFMMFSSYNNSIESQKTKFAAAVRLLLAATGIRQSDTTGTIKEDSALYKDANGFCEMVPFVKESKEYIYK